MNRFYFLQMHPSAYAPFRDQIRLSESLSSEEQHHISIELCVKSAFTSGLAVNTRLIVDEQKNAAIFIL